MVDKELKKKKDEEAAQVWTSIRPEAALCKSCFNALEDTEFTVGAEKAFCKVYVAPDEKPTDVLWKGADCKYHIPKE